ncbi:MAG: 4-hydroxyphenylacetate 3-hydroxylase N-terminal domain-containing protein, partial [Gammaproteobacteria bacterium]
MIRTGEQYRESLRDGREVYMDGVRVEDITTHPSFKPLIDIRARIYDMQHEESTQNLMTFEENGERFPIGNQIPREQEHWHAKRNAVDALMKDIG